MAAGQAQEAREMGLGLQQKRKAGELIITLNIQ